MHAGHWAPERLCSLMIAHSNKHSWGPPGNRTDRFPHLIRACNALQMSAVPWLHFLWIINIAQAPSCSVGRGKVDPSSPSQDFRGQGVTFAAQGFLYCLPWVVLAEADFLGLVMPFVWTALSFSFGSTVSRSVCVCIRQGAFQSWFWVVGGEAARTKIILRTLQPQKNRVHSKYSTSFQAAEVNWVPGISVGKKQEQFYCREVFSKKESVWELEDVMAGFWYLGLL